MIKTFWLFRKNHPFHYFLIFQLLYHENVIYINYLVFHNYSNVDYFVKIMDVLKENEQRCQSDLIIDRFNSFFDGRWLVKSNGGDVIDQNGGGQLNETNYRLYHFWKKKNDFSGLPWQRCSELIKVPSELYSVATLQRDGGLKRPIKSEQVSEFEWPMIERVEMYSKRPQTEKLFHWTWP